ncbi:MAG TPA: membrane protein insertase YidC [Candidatus Binatia bacterium]|jgi:YidC/Oxa1 family membrane protein insertase
MDKRAIIGVALSILVLVVYQQLVTHYYGPPPTASAPEAEKGGREKGAVPAQNGAASPAPALPATPATLPAPRSAKEITVETDNYIAVFTTQGARLKSFKFKKFRSSVDENSPPFEIVRTAPDVPLPLGVRWQTPAPFEDGDLLYSVQGGDLKLTGDSKSTLVFQGQNGDGLVVTKSFTFTGSSYPIQLEVAVKSPNSPPPIPELLLADQSDQATPNHDAPFEGFIALVDNKIKREHPAEAAKGQEFSGDVSWAGFGHTYFLFALLPDNGAQHKVSVHQAGAALVGAISGTTATEQYTLFVGPKEIDTLKSVGKGIERSIDFGIFWFISIPLLYILHFFHRFTASYGFDIIILTVLIKILMAPLTHKSYVSMKQMQKLQPQMERLKERYSDDKEKLNKEIMELYKRNGVNPLGGCLPMVLQLPVFYGLYNCLGTPIELRHAAFMWIKDLSQPDWKSLPFTVPWWPPFFWPSAPSGIPVLTLLMGASMFLQQWMTPSAGDPNQRKMMMLMPLMFTFMFVSFPAGLTVYWLVNNLLTIGQQHWINRSVK